VASAVLLAVGGEVDPEADPEADPGVCAGVDTGADVWPAEGDGEVDEVPPHPASASRRSRGSRRRTRQR
jgi:hypothetical protein